MAKIAKKDVDTFSYKGWLNSDKFLKRSFAALGYQIVAALIVYGIILGIVIIVLLFIFLASLAF